MQMAEVARLIEALRALGLTGDEVNDFLLYVGKGDEGYKPKNIRGDNINPEKKED